ncbi:MAG TPA: hypothetical protein VF288_08330 [Mycobacteriales bacterium]
MLRELAHPDLLLGLVIAVLVGLFGHNLAQAWTARALGDRTAERAGFGRPRWRQLEPLGVVAAALTVGAWGIPSKVPVATHFRRSRTRAVAILLAGPVFLVLVSLAGVAVTQAALPTPGSSAFAYQVARAFTISIGGLTVMSCLPFPPLALGRALWMWAPTSPGWSRARLALEEESIGTIIAFAVLLLPLLFSGLPDVVGQLEPPLLRHLDALLPGTRIFG